MHRMTESAHPFFKLADWGEVIAYPALRLRDRLTETRVGKHCICLVPGVRVSCIHGSSMQTYKDKNVMKRDETWNNVKGDMT